MLLLLTVPALPPVRAEKEIPTMSDAAAKLLTQAIQARRENRPADAERDLIAAVALCREANVRSDLARALASLGQIERDLGRLDSARRHYEESAALYREEGDGLRLAHTIRHVGDIHLDQGRTELAEPSYNEALDLYRNHSQTSPLDLANAIRGLAILKEENREFDQATLRWEEARKLYEAVNVAEGVAESSRRLARLVKRSGG